MKDDYAYIFYAKSQLYDVKESGPNENKYDHYNRT